jgi:hypothetical protein
LAALTLEILHQPKNLSDKSESQHRKAVSMLGYLSPASLRTPDHMQGIFVTLLPQAVQSNTRALTAVMPSC